MLLGVYPELAPGDARDRRDVEQRPLMEHVDPSEDWQANKESLQV